LSVVSVVCCQRSLRRADHSSRGVLPTMVRNCVWSRKPREWGGHDPRWVAAPQQKKKSMSLNIKEIILVTAFWMCILWVCCIINSKAL